MYHVHGSEQAFEVLYPSSKELKHLLLKVLDSRMVYRVYGCIIY